MGMAAVVWGEVREVEREVGMVVVTVAVAREAVVMVALPAAERAEAREADEGAVREVALEHNLGEREVAVMVGARAVAVRAAAVAALARAAGRVAGRVAVLEVAMGAAREAARGVEREVVVAAVTVVVVRVVVARVVVVRVEKQGEVATEAERAAATVVVARAAAG